ncbi:sulfite exporter TauE/SafE family protein [Cupriavidus sp. AU9028]|uniref:sulfite exporter TauE/SafE family protein n=1 Tax=Cupriavidus sp. AU9028 TaxID=2871157 RepID=UPI001C9800A6|nr:sulfite exporter TauE/SafE family protein [Cupriavidus sp. AU9028]MBY4896438.1 sulfite exporter TauE/SafE family protein [Cupriavidus sp. AU9028]
MEYLIVALGAAAGGFVQGLSGFAFGLTAMSLWAWTLEPRLAASLTLFGSLVGQIIAAVRVRRGFDARALLPFLAGGLLGIPLGVAILPYLDMRLFKLVFGAFLLLWCPAMLFAPRLPAVRWGGRAADGAAGVIGGAMSGIGGFSGAVPTLWCTLRGLPKDRQRSVIQNFNLTILAATMLVYLGTGAVSADTVPMFAIVAAAVLVPVLLGSRLYRHLDEAAFRRIVLTLLTLSGVAMLVSGLRMG